MIDIISCSCTLENLTDVFGLQPWCKGYWRWRLCFLVSLVSCLNWEYTYTLVLRRKASVGLWCICLLFRYELLFEVKFRLEAYWVLFLADWTLLIIPISCTFGYRSSIATGQLNLTKIIIMSCACNVECNSFCSVHWLSLDLLQTQTFFSNSHQPAGLGW